ncbi:Flp family type IVb pilin [Flaviflagellibacter deserti]|uniref:Flp family type IVb pilin n=1 Tax=Flaviflagellibacter deserti TaxID=2267266 RepID=A0ABV9Z1C3_9HYPH
MNLFSRFLKDESGATAIEYALIAAVLAIGILLSLPTLRQALNDTFDEVSDQLDTARETGTGTGG